MKILFDIVHPADVNFFYNFIYILRRLGHEVFITGLNRGTLPCIIKKEFPDIEVKIIGKHRGNLFSIILEANLSRFFKYLRYIKKYNFDIGFSFLSFPHCISFWVLNKPNIQFDDDPERRLSRLFGLLFASEIYYPPIISSKGKSKTFNSLKEWAYLSPKYFEPNINELTKYSLTSQQYIFIREVSTGSLNYINQSSNIIATFADKMPKDFNVVLSLEDKKNKDLYPKNWILLHEPLNDIHSLMYYSKCVISSGDSMAREGAILGVPSIYCGIREMQVNNVLINKNMLFKVKPNNVPEFINKIINNEIVIQKQNEFISNLNNDWDDITEFICKKVNTYNKDTKIS
jgi:predicted glycosyltransferase